MQSTSIQILWAGLAALVFFAGLYLASLYHYLLFHAIAEGFSIVIACGIFMLAWNTRRYSDNNYLLFIGIAYLFVAILDFVHTLSFRGMPIFAGHGANAATQLWVGARYMEALTLLAAPFFTNRRIRASACFAVYGIAAAALLLSIFYRPVFPDCFLPASGGLTAFKIASEYVICLLLFVSALLFIRQRQAFERRILFLFLGAIAATILGELAFTTYASVFDVSNLLGHYFKIVSFYLLYKAVIETGLERPFSLLFRDLNQQRQRLRVTLKSIGDGVIVTDRSRAVTFLNRVAEELTGWSAAESYNQPVEKVFRIINEASGQSVKSPVDAVLESGVIAGLANHTLLVRKDGRQIPINDSGAPIRDDEGRILGVVLVFRDITERRRAEDEMKRFNEILEQRVAERTRLAQQQAMQLKAQAVELVKTEERERQRISRILHDDLQQTLAAARLQLETACAAMADASLLENAGELVDAAISRSRHLSHELNPPILNQSGLAEALEWLAGRMADQFGLHVETALEEVPDVENETLKIFLFRAAQELLFNTVKHAGVENARLALTCSDGWLGIHVSDAGEGFDPALMETASRKSGMGLAALRERTRSMGGHLRIESGPGRGSRFELSVPLQAPGFSEDS